MLDRPLDSPTLESKAPLFADVIVPRHFAGPFTYLIPSQLRPVLRVGHLVFVPFGRSLVQGAVIALTSNCPPEITLDRLKAIRTLVTGGPPTEITGPLLELAKTVAETYVAAWGQCLRLVLPPKASSAERTRLILTKEGEHALAVKESLSPAVIHLLKRLKRRPLGISLSRLSSAKDPGDADSVRSVLDRGWAHKLSSRELHVKERLPDPVEPAPPLLLAAETLRFSHRDIPTEVHEWQSPLLRMLEAKKACRHMVQAPADERLALLRCAVARTVAQGRKVLVITGEAARAESLAAALDDPGWATGVFHSMMPDKRRADIWHRICENQVSVAVGTRAALFLPFHGIGLIWIDREEDPALKEPMEPRYHAREVAWMRAQQEQALLVLASAHLSLEASSLEASDGVVQAPEQEDRPQVEVVDLRAEDRRLLLSSRLYEAMRDAIAGHAGVLLFLNRKAYAGALVCRDCGQAPRCSLCAVSLAFSRQKHVLFCHYCGGTQPTPDLCGACGSPRLQPVGDGTERLEEEVRRRFPLARVLRVDGEMLRRSKESAAIWERVRCRDWDVLVGTQVLLRNEIVPRLGLVGAVQADAGLSLPDFRAAERTYHMLHDAASLVQPMSAGGRLIIQSYLPSHHAIQAVARHDETVFKSEELMQRTALGFPPALRVIILHVSGAEESAVERASKEWVAGLSRAANAALASGELAVLGPVRSPVARVRGRYRRQILIKSRSPACAVQAIRSTLSELESAYGRRRVKFDVDVDPIDMW